jgi:hypothetical protein
MSRPDTYLLTRAALERAGLRVAPARMLRDIDSVTDADAVAGLVDGGLDRDAWHEVTR